ncbi:MAG: O-acetyl-ADP-ribose deacetylase [Chloroflexota bacterium]|nr:MAG: O-acetyl-ADP-ribose deacetylase [Chloroflexota bacterium]
MQVQINRTALELVEGDITELDTDAIVNAANEHLAHGGGVAGVIARKGGPTIQRESDAWVRRHGPVPTGSAAITSGGDLKARYVIHAVGPVYDGTPRSAELLASAVRAALRMADEHGLRSVALPAISTGIFGYPMEEAAQVMLRAAIEYLRGETGLKRVVFCLYGRSAFEVFARELAAQVRLSA